MKHILKILLFTFLFQLYRKNISKKKLFLNHELKNS